MQTGLIYDYKDEDSYEIELVAKRRGIEVTPIHFTNLTICLTDLPRLHRQFAEIQAAINRCTVKARREHAAMLLQTLNKPVINPFQVELIVNSKRDTLLALAEKGIKTPKTLFFPQNVSKKAKTKVRVIADTIEEELGYPTILKPDRGSEGRNVLKADDRRGLEVGIASIRRGTANPLGIIAQEFFLKSFDLRVVVSKIAGKQPQYLGTLVRVVPRIDEFRTNTSIGGYPLSIDLPMRIRKEALRVAEAIIDKALEKGLPSHWSSFILGIDMMPRVGQEEDQKIKYLARSLDKCFNTIREIKQEPSYVSNQDKFENRRRKVEEVYREYRQEKAYLDVLQKIQEVVDEKTTVVLPHEVNSSLDYWFNTKNMIDVNLAENYIDCILSTVK
jgi:glutathione synthase/RimK-type ligase-like ATP-grasp enzyme